MESYEERCSLDRFPDKIVAQIMNKVIDLKTLCICKVVTKRISSIVRKVDTICFTTPLVNHNVVTDLDKMQEQVIPNDNRYPFQSESFITAMNSLNDFKLVKSLHIRLPSSCLHEMDDSIIMKWKLVFGNEISAPYVFILYANSVYDSAGNKLCAGSEPLFPAKQLINEFCLSDAITRQRMLSYFVDDFHYLEKLSITDVCKRGKVFVDSRRMIYQQRHRLAQNDMEVMSSCHIPSLKLPVLGYFIKGVSLIMFHRIDDDFDTIEFDDDFEDERDAAFTEAIKEILMKHRDKLRKTKI